MHRTLKNNPFCQRIFDMNADVSDRRRDARVAEGPHRAMTCISHITTLKCTVQFEYRRMPMVVKMIGITSYIKNDMYTGVGDRRRDARVFEDPLVTYVHTDISILRKRCN